MKSVSGDQLAGDLIALGIVFVRDGQKPGDAFIGQPAQLLAALAASNEARLRLALIPLFLQHPGYFSSATTADRRLHPDNRVTLRCYYTAARFLQQKYRDRLEALLGYQSVLPDLFSKKLHLGTISDPETSLIELARRHQELSGLHINWHGTYEHAAIRLITHLEREKEWQL